MFVFMTN
ncbi:hypothetical protein D032_4974A, partial [Vibrio parahaemolyticus V14/01]